MDGYNILYYNFLKKLEKKINVIYEKKERIERIKSEERMKKE